MAAVTLTPADLAPFAEIPDAKAEPWIRYVMATAARVAPCITSTDFAHADEAQGILVGIILRWNDQGASAPSVQSRTVARGPFSESETYDSQQKRRGAFWPSEIESLQELCRTSTEQSGAFTVDTVGVVGNVGHAESCALNFGALYCSCGAVLTQNLYPLYEV